MITTTDIKKLAKHFATKTELQDVKSELKAEMIAMRVELRQEIGSVRDEVRSLRTEMHQIANHIIESVTEAIKGTNQKVDTLEKTVKSNSVAIQKHENRWTQFRTLASNI